MMPMKSNRGFTLLEVMIASAIFTVVGMLSFLVLSSSNESVVLTSAKSEVQANLRDTMNALTTEVRSAYTARLAGTPGADVNAEPLEVLDDGTTLQYRIPDPSRVWGSHTVPGVSSQIRIEFENEDANGNGILDPGEDTNEDGVLTRRLVRIQDGVRTVLGASNEIESVQYTLLPHPSPNNNWMTRLRIDLTASKVYGAKQDKRVWAELSATVNLAN